MNEKQLRNDLIKLAKAHPGQVREALLPILKQAGPNIKINLKGIQIALQPWTTLTPKELSNLKKQFNEDTFLDEDTANHKISGLEVHWRAPKDREDNSWVGFDLKSQDRLNAKEFTELMNWVLFESNKKRWLPQEAYASKVFWKYMEPAIEAHYDHFYSPGTWETMGSKRPTIGDIAYDFALENLDGYDPDFFEYFGGLSSFNLKRTGAGITVTTEIEVVVSHDG